MRGDARGDYLRSRPHAVDESDRPKGDVTHMCINRKLGPSVRPIVIHPFGPSTMTMFFFAKLSTGICTKHDRGTMGTGLGHWQRT